MCRIRLVGVVYFGLCVELCSLFVVLLFQVLEGMDDVGGWVCDIGVSIFVWVWFGCCWLVGNGDVVEDFFVSDFEVVVVGWFGYGYCWIIWVGEEDIG